MAKKNAFDEAKEYVKMLLNRGRGVVNTIKQSPYGRVATATQKAFQAPYKPQTYQALAARPANQGFNQYVVPKIKQAVDYTKQTVKQAPQIMQQQYSLQNIARVLNPMVMPKMLSETYLYNPTEKKILPQFQSWGELPDPRELINWKTLSKEKKKDILTKTFTPILALSNAPGQVPHEVGLAAKAIKQGGWFKTKIDGKTVWMQRGIPTGQPSTPKLSAPIDIENSVVQIKDVATGKIEFKVIPKGQLPIFQKLIDSAKGIAGYNVNGKVYHLTAKSPEQMQEAGAEPTGVVKPEDIPSSTSEIKPEDIGVVTGDKYPYVISSTKPQPGPAPLAQEAKGVMNFKTSPSGAKYGDVKEVSRLTKTGVGNYEIGDVYQWNHPDPKFKEYSKKVIVAGPEVNGKIPTYSFLKGGEPTAMPELTPKSELQIIRNENMLPEVKGVGGVTALQPSQKELKTLATKVKQETLPVQPTPKGKLTTPSTKAKIRPDTVVRTSIKIIPPKARGDISAPEVNFRNWKDKPALSLSRETMERNLESVAGTDAPKIKKFIVEPARLNETKSVEWQNAKKNLIKTEVVQKLGIKQGSLEDKLIQRFGEGNINLNQLKQTTSKWQQVQQAAGLFKEQYKEILTQVNLERKRFGYNPIPERKDYFRHYQEITGAIRQFGLILREQDLPTEISGLTSIFKPGKPFTTAELQRRGGPYTESAIGGFENYINSIARQIFHIESVQRGRALEKYIREAGKGGEANLSNFVANLTEWTNLLSGKKAQFDRAFESLLGRQVYGISNFLRRRTSANMIGGNISSALTNYIPFTQFLSTTFKANVLKGMLDAVASPLQKDFYMVDGIKSNFLARRFPQGKISPNFIQKAGELANWLFVSVDKFTAKSIVSGKYYENLGKGLDSAKAMSEADTYAGKTLADRSIGQLPNLMNTQTIGFLTQFQTEINNAWSFITKDIPNLSEGNRLHLMSMLAQFVLYSYIFNNIYEKITGRRPTIDPIYYVLELGGLVDQTKDKPLLEKGLVAAKDLSENLPFVGGITGGRLPIGAALPDVPALIKGQTTWGKELMKPVTYLAPPFGGGQIKKIIEGGKMILKGGSETTTGRVRFKAPETLLGKAQAVLFGQYSTKEARDYFNQDQSVLGPKQSETFKGLPPEQRTPYMDYIYKQRDFDAAETALKNGEKITGFNEKEQTYITAEYIFYLKAVRDVSQRKAQYEAIKSKITPEIEQMVWTIGSLSKEGFAKADRQMVLMTPDQRAQAIVERFKTLTDKKRKLKLLELYRKYGLLTPEVEQKIVGGQ